MPAVKKYDAHPLTNFGLYKVLVSMDIIELALQEDIGGGDVTSQYFIKPQEVTRAVIVAREACVLAGGKAIIEIFQRVDPMLKVSILKPDGSLLSAGDRVFEVIGLTRSILAAERTALNFVQRLSGIATLTRRYVDAIVGTPAILLDTRKTTPGLRELEKAAVVAGGGQNHRFGLFDKILVKDNHLIAVSDNDIIEAIACIHRERPNLEIELEADTLEQVRKFSSLKGVNRILLDNMSPDQIRQALIFRRPNITFEASGGINLQNIREIAETGVDYISVGSLTHAARAIDFALDCW